jgi:hypothetical protein
MEKSDQKDTEVDYRSEPTQIELAKLESALLQAEYKYSRDITKLQEALLRARKLGILNFIGLHLRIVFILESSKTLPLERALFKWKSRCVTNHATRNKLFLKIMKSLHKTIITRAFYVMKERRFRRALSEKEVEGPVYARGAVSPLSSDDDDLDI